MEPLPHIDRVLSVLQRSYGPETTLDKVSETEDPFRVLVATILSQRTRDEVTEEAATRLFARFPDAQTLAKASSREIGRLIKPVGFYPTKARRIKKVAATILKKHKGKVPSSMEELVALEGVGPKTAACVLVYGHGLPAVAVDTHVNRVCQRIGWIKEKTPPEKTHVFLERVLTPEQKLQINSLFVSFGKKICKPIKPRCSSCAFTKYCKYYRGGNPRA